MDNIFVLQFSGEQRYTFETADGSKIREIKIIKEIKEWIGKMELAYLYIEEYRNLKDVNINFTQQVHIEYDKEQNVLTCKQKESLLLEDFWGENIGSLSMIVGSNGVGKTSLMQYIISICEDIITQESSVDYGILVLKEGNKLFYYETVQKNALKSQLKVENNDKFSFEKKDVKELRNVCEKTKVIYLTNAISYTDYKRNRKKSYDRFSLLYDCSVGGLMYLDSAFDVNLNLRKIYNEISELENYYIYEKYKQVKFVFDKKQYEILKELRKSKYPVPVPEVLYINLFLDNQIRTVIDLEMEKEQSWNKLDNKLFPQETEKNENDLMGGKGRQINIGGILRYQFCRCCIWGMVRSIVRRFGGILNRNLLESLWQEETDYEETENEFCQAIEYIWRTCEKIICKTGEHWEGEFKELENTYKKYYLEFIEYIECIGEEELSKHFRLEEHLGDVRQSKLQEEVIRISLSVPSNEDWFSAFLKKYRYTSNPDYYLDFDWGLSSGETNLLSTFALLYCIFPMDYTNERNGECKIYNKWNGNEGVECDSVIIMADEVDLTFHPEWQRQYISLLTAFLSKVYSPSCCKNIQLILSTHSPILLSDIPQQSVIYLKSNKEKSDRKVEIDNKHIPTFGQNIHLLFRDSFFLENGIMGEFAKKKIQECFDEIQKIEKEIKEMSTGKEVTEERYKEYNTCLAKQKNIATLVAEPIIKKKLLLEIQRVQNELDRKFKASNREMFMQQESKKNSREKIVSLLSDYSKEEIEDILKEISSERAQGENDKDSNI